MLCNFYLRANYIMLYIINSHALLQSVHNPNFFRPFANTHKSTTGRTKRGSFKGKKYQRSKKRRKQQGGFFNLPALIGSLFAPKRAAPRRRPQTPRRPPPPRPNYATQNRAPPPQRRRQQGGFITDSVNYGFDEQSTQKKRTKQKGGSVLPLNKIPWVKRVHPS